MSDDLALTVGDQTISGWIEVRVTRGIERCPSDFEISLTERFPGEASEVVVKAGDKCEVRIGDDVVVTGYVDSYVPSISADGHSVRVCGRGKCQDLVDCAAEWDGGQITGSSALQIAAKLASAYEDLQVWAQGEDVGPQIPQINLILGETAWEIIERVCRFRGLLAYEMTDGNLFLGGVGTALAASGFEEGVNVQSASMQFSMAQRFSEYQALLVSMDVLGDVGQGGNLRGVANDEGVRRNRKMMIVAEYGDSGADVALRRAQWEAARRVGRANCLQLTADSWRDASGKLWEPNTLVPLQLPSLKVVGQSWLISEVTYKRGEQGTTADLTIMPREAFLPQPVVLNPTAQEVPAFTQATP
jgi:prophage tail gpP-like protein